MISLPARNPHFLCRQQVDLLPKEFCVNKPMAMNSVSVIVSMQESLCCVHAPAAHLSRAQLRPGHSQGVLCSQAGNVQGRVGFTLPYSTLQ